jgi:pyoverdine/dityrosine biosynthesis protein Dit1
MRAYTLPLGTSPLAWQSNDEATPIALRVLRLLFRFRRLHHPEESCARTPCQACFTPHLERVSAFIRQQKPILLVLPAFPAKSPNPSKVLGRLPDMAEQVALRFLQSVCDQITLMYPPGARVVIGSTGHVLSDLVSVRDEDALAYRGELGSLITQLGAHSLELVSLEQALHGSFEKMRDRLSSRYAAPLEQVRQRTVEEPTVRALFNGLHQRLLEDEQVLHPERSPSKALMRSKELACRIIQRDDAWRRLLGERFPEAVSLSIHPQPAHSEHLGLHLMRTGDAWLTPWTGVLLESGGALMLVTRHEAERRNASLIWLDERPSHFVTHPPPRSKASLS